MNTFVGISESSASNSEVYEEFRKIRHKVRNAKEYKFINWAPVGPKFSLSVANEGKEVCNGNMFLNTTAVKDPLKKILNDYDKLKKRNAFLVQFKNNEKINNIDELMKEARSLVGDSLKEYIKSENGRKVNQESS